MVAAANVAVVLLVSVAAAAASPLLGSGRKVCKHPLQTDNNDHPSIVYRLGSNGHHLQTSLKGNTRQQASNCQLGNHVHNLEQILMLVMLMLRQAMVKIPASNDHLPSIYWKNWDSSGHRRMICHCCNSGHRSRTWECRNIHPQVSNGLLDSGCNHCPSR
mmetsp:Transcript_2911/g.5517  ORF Transcript_2911/g.5517 Transcript_2911/m.5517 type:complete len:160 (-) Transcript_2911:161-640(-)